SSTTSSSSSSRRWTLPPRRTSTTVPSTFGVPPGSGCARPSAPPPAFPSHRDAANARERARMRVLSKAFSRLKTTLPWVPPDTKLSKLDTLRLASSYISHLRRLLQDHSLDDAYVKTASLV
uniref:Musculin n=1 Tax=Hippocampus comes TaxID=109280 RepID=A0A3Q2YR30_HIPCM